MSDLLAALARTVPGADAFEDASLALVRAVLDEAHRLLAGSRWAGAGQILRGMVHLRPGGDWRGLLVLPFGADRPTTVVGGLAPSLSTWERVRADGQPLAVDVLAGSVSSKASVQRLLARETSHLLALPLRSPGSAEPQGMVVVEASCPLAMGEPFCWDEDLGRLQAAIDLAAPSVLALPARSRDVERDDPLLPVVGTAMAGLVHLLEVFAGQAETLLISGPTGSGKSRLAQWVHARSGRSEGPFETLELLAVPEAMQMGELFGWRKGAFTGAVRDQAGAVERAAGGTLFLDEIDKLSLKAQAGLLQLLETRTYRPLGDSGRVRRADVRFVVGTNADLLEAVDAGRFREDLYYRVNVLPVRLPPLAERTDELDAWAAFMLERRHVEAGREGPGTLAADVGPVLRMHDWPGNLRQLDNVVRRAFAIALVDGATTVDRRHVDHALAFELPDVDATASGLMPALRRAAAMFVDAAARLDDAGQVLELDHAVAFRGLVLEAARDRTGSVRGAFELLGRAAVVRNRNHTKEFKKELARVDALAVAASGD